MVGAPAMSDREALAVALFLLVNAGVIVIFTIDRIASMLRADAQRIRAQAERIAERRLLRQTPCAKPTVVRGFGR